jgi:integrase
MLIRMKGIKKVRAKGRLYYYHRRTGERIMAEPGTLAFFEEVERLNGRRPPSEHKAGTLGGLIAAYKGGPEFDGLAAATKKDYQKVFDYLRPLDALPVLQIDPPFVIGLRDKAFKKRKRRFANYCLQVLSLLFNWGKPRGWLMVNPADDIPLIKRPKGMPRANRPWTDDERETVLREAPAYLIAGIGLGMFIGLRLGDVVKFPWSSCVGGQINLDQSKTGAELWVTMPPRLGQILAATTRLSPVVMTNTLGRPYRYFGFRGALSELFARLEAEGKVGAGLTFHGLRHTVGNALGEEGCDPQTIAAILGQKSLAMAKHYSDRARRGKLASAAVRKLNKRWKTRVENHE